MKDICVMSYKNDLANFFHSYMAMQVYFHIEGFEDAPLVFLKNNLRAFVGWTDERLHKLMSMGKELYNMLPHVVTWNEWDRDWQALLYSIQRPMFFGSIYPLMCSSWLHLFEKFRYIEEQQGFVIP